MIAVVSISTYSPTMRVDRRAPSAMTEENLPAPISRLIQLRHTIAQPVFAAFLAGGVAGAVSRTVVSPLERLKILFQIQSAGRTGYKLPIGQGLMKMWRDEGWRGLMRGNGANCIRIIPYSAVQFASYNFYQKASRYLKSSVSYPTQADLITKPDAGYDPRGKAAPLEESRLWSIRGNYLGHFHLPT